MAKGLKRSSGKASAGFRQIPTPQGGLGQATGMPMAKPKSIKKAPKPSSMAPTGAPTGMAPAPAGAPMPMAGGAGGLAKGGNIPYPMTLKKDVQKAGTGMQAYRRGGRTVKMAEGGGLPYIPPPVSPLAQATRQATVMNTLRGRENPVPSVGAGVLPMAHPASAGMKRGGRMMARSKK